MTLYYMQTWSLLFLKFLSIIPQETITDQGVYNNNIFALAVFPKVTVPIALIKSILFLMINMSDYTSELVLHTNNRMFNGRLFPTIEFDAIIDRASTGRRLFGVHAYPLIRDIAQFIFESFLSKKVILLTYSVAEFGSYNFFCR